MVSWSDAKQSPPLNHKRPLVPRPGASRAHLLYKIKNQLHRRLVESLNLENLDLVDNKLVEEEIRNAIAKLLEEVEEPLRREEVTRLEEELEFEILGLGPLEPLLRDPSISDILVNRYDDVYIERNGILEETDVRFQNDAHLMKIITKIVNNVGRRIDESSPLVDARLPDGSRVNAVIGPLALDSPVLSIRRFSINRPTLDDLVGYGSLTPEIGQVLEALVKAKLNILISGGTGSGKTTLLNIMSAFTRPKNGSSPSRTPPNSNCSKGM